jgi:RimJ/RimL family protein N-acetyltransferase
MFAQLLLSMCGISTAMFPCRMAGKGVILRCYRLTDVARLHRLVSADVLPQANGMVYEEPPTFGAFYFWMRTTFPMLYVIEDTAHGRPRVVGCVGMYDLTIGHKLWISLAIFRPEDRRRGYGQRAVSLLLVGLARSRVFSKVYADVLRTNTPSLQFFIRLGFVPDRKGPDYIRLVKHIGQP